MQHLTEEQLVAFHYRDLDFPRDAAAHLRECADCAKQYETLCGVLALVSDMPVPERGQGYGEEVWRRLRWKLGAPQRRRRWQSVATIAAMLALAFFSGLLWRSRRDVSTQEIATTTGANATVAAQPSVDPNKLLLVVVGDHLESSGRMLLEVANAGTDSQLDAPPRRAEDLVAANRIYRQTAAQNGDERIAQLLSDLEPILLEIANAGGSLEGKKLADLQKRIESRGLLFKVRVMGAPGGELESAPAITEIDSL
ncbi:MAG TPA: hypothetical protein VF057_06030 [Thermoanaerobaculia bacterium]